MYIHIHTHILDTQFKMCMYTHTHIYTHIHTRIHTYTHTHILDVHRNWN